jgi:hypothetical protein
MAVVPNETGFDLDTDRSTENLRSTASIIEHGNACLQHEINSRLCKIDSRRDIVIETIMPPPQ